MIWMVAVAVDNNGDRDKGGGSGGSDKAEMVKGVAETVANWEVGQIIGTDSEGTMF
jgi:hypothetical protein